MVPGSLLWLLILLSALLYDVAFFSSEYLGFLVLPSLFLVFWVLIKVGQTLNGSIASKFYARMVRYTGRSSRVRTQCVYRGIGRHSPRAGKFGPSVFWYGLAWGVLVFSFHFIWLLVLLLDKVKSGTCFAIFVYLFSITYFSFTSAVWVWVTQLIFRKVRDYFSSCDYYCYSAAQFSIFLITCYCYFYLLENYALWFLGRIEGYPFLNPLIPLVNFELFTKTCVFAGILFGRGVGYQSGLPACKLAAADGVEFIYLKPDTASFDQNSVSYEYQIYRKLCDLKLWERRDEDRQFIILAPESSFPFPLNTYPGFIELWSSVLPDNAHLFIGTQHEFKGKICQAVSWVNQRRIKKIYVKKHCVPFVEKIPRFYKKLEVLQRIFLNKAFSQEISQFSRAKKLKQENYFEFNCIGDSQNPTAVGRIIFIPQICSELFFVSSYKTFSGIVKACNAGSRDKPAGCQANSAYIIFSVNDSWFMGYFKKIMQDGARLKSVLSGIPLIYVGHEKLKFLDTNF